MSIFDWHERYTRQAGWTQAARDYVIRQIGLPLSAAVLDVGCGTGALYQANGLTRVFGVDIDRSALRFFKSRYANAPITRADANHLPFAEATFEAAFTHFLLLWVKDPDVVVREMARVVNPGGWVICFAEPDHEARVDHPLDNERVGASQTASLREQGAATNMGRRVGSILARAGLEEVKFGLLGGEWSADVALEPTEERVLENDLNVLGKTGKYAAGDGAFSFIPTFYAFGRRPADGIIRF